MDARSDEVDVLEVGRLVEACRICVSRFPSQVAYGVSGRDIHSEKVDLEVSKSLSTTNHIQSYLEVCFPSFRSLSCVVLSISTLMESGSQWWAVSIGVGDVCKEKLTLGTDFKLEIFKGIAIRSRHEYLYYIFFPKWVIAIIVCWDNFGINAGPSHKQMLVVVTDRCSGRRIRLTVDSRERKHYRISGFAVRNV